MGKPITISTTIHGPFFDLKGQPLEDATKATIRDLIKEGEAKVGQQLYPGHGVRTGAFKSSIHSQIASSLHGTIDTDKAVLGKFLESGRYWRSTGHRFRGYGMFRKATAHLRRIAREIAGKQYARAVKRLT